MPKLTDDKLTDFLRNSISYLENRISILDTKADILIASVGVILAAFTYTIKEVFLTDTPSFINVWGHVFLGGVLVIFVVIAMFLIRTIRPGKGSWAGNIPLAKMKMDKYVMWYTKEFPASAEEYLALMKSLDAEDIKMNYYRQHFTSLQLVRNKYVLYTKATIWMRVLMLWSFIGLLVLAVLKVRGL